MNLNIYVIHNKTHTKKKHNNEAQAMSEGALGYAPRPHSQGTAKNYEYFRDLYKFIILLPRFMSLFVELTLQKELASFA